MLDRTLKVIAVGQWDDVAKAWVGADKALDTTGEDYRKLRAAYIDARTDENRDALPLLKGATPILWHVSVPLPEQWPILADLRGMQRATFAVQTGVHAVTDRQGTVHRAKVKNGMAGDEWVQKLHKAGGGALVRELGDVVYVRGLNGDRDEGDADPLAL